MLTRTYTLIHTVAKRERERETDRQIDRQTDRLTEFVVSRLFDWQPSSPCLTSLRLAYQQFVYWGDTEDDVLTV